MPIHLTKLKLRRFIGKLYLKGLKALSKVLEIDLKVVNNFLEFLNTNLSQEYNVVENFKKLLELAVNSDHPNLDEIYVCNHTEHWARFQQLYKIIAEEHRKTNSTLELLDMQTLRKQLIEEKFITNNNYPKRIFCDDYLGGKVSKVIKVVDFQKIL